MDALCAEFLRGLPKSVTADPKKTAKALHKHWIDRTFYLDGKSKYYLKVASGNYVAFSLEALREQVALGGLLYTKESAKRSSWKYAPKNQPLKPASENERKKEARDQVTRYLAAVRERNYIEWVGEFAGKSPGRMIINQVPCLIRRGPALIEPKEGDSSAIDNIITSLFGRDPKQEETYLACLQRVARLVHEGRYEPTQIIFLAGDPDDGKTLLATEIMSPCLGGRRIDAIPYFIGSTRFNADITRCELWLIDDQGDIKTVDIHHYNNNLKKSCSTPDFRSEPKGIDAINACYLLHQTVVIFNLNEDGVSPLLPILSEDCAGKYQLFRTQRADLPTGPKQFQTLQKQIQDALPAFLHRLLYTFKPSAEILSGDRFQIRPYHNSEICAFMDVHNKAFQLLPHIEQWLNDAKRDEWFGSSGELLRELNQQPGLSAVLSMSYKSEFAFQRAISELSRRFPDRVTKTHIEEGNRYCVRTKAKAEGRESAIKAAGSKVKVVKARFDAAEGSEQARN